MPREFYLDLSEDAIALCEELLHRAAEWHLPIRRKENFIGFGKSHGFYMFWIAYKDGVAYFKARRAYDYNQAQEIAYYHLASENKELILKAAEHIYQEYLAARESMPVFQKSVATPSVTHTSSWSEMAERVVLSRREGAQNTADACQMAREFARLADEQLQFLLCDVAATRPKTSEKDIRTWKEYVLLDTNTLRSIAPEYGVSHERIRLIVKKIDKRLHRLFQKHCLSSDRAEFAERNEQMIALLKGVDDALIPFLCEGFAEWGKRKRESVLRLLFGEEAAKTLCRECEVHQKAEIGSRASKMLLQKAARLQEMIQYPTQVYADTQEQVGSFALEKEFLYLARFRKRLEELQDYLCYVQKPNVVYYSSTQTDHRPDFLLEWKDDGRRVLVVVLPTINMAYSYNLTRFCALREYCEKKGYGYLIVNDRDRSFEEVKCFPVPPVLQTALDAILVSKGRIVWPDILALRETYKLTNDLIAGYVLQNGLRFVTSPYFCICRFSGE